MYVAGALLVFFVAVGMGAAAALLVGWQPERAQAGYGGAAGSETREETAPAEAKTGADAFEGTAIEPDDGEEGTNTDREEPTEEPPPEDTAKGASFVHRATDGNSRGDYTYLDDPLTNGEPGAVVLVTQNWNPGGGPGVYNDHPVGLLYDEDVQKWAIENRDGARMPDGAAFNVAVSGSDESAG